jgi:phosphomethylpyrimidine synthase
MRATGYAAGLGDNEKAALNLAGAGSFGNVGMTMSGVIEDGMAQMSEKFKSMGEQLYLDAEKVKQSNKALS